MKTDHSPETQQKTPNPARTPEITKHIQARKPTKLFLCSSRIFAKTVPAHKCPRKGCTRHDKVNFTIITTAIIIIIFRINLRATIDIYHSFVFNAGVFC